MHLGYFSQPVWELEHLFVDWKESTSLVRWGIPSSQLSLQETNMTLPFLVGDTSSDGCFFHCNVSFF